MGRELTVRLSDSAFAALQRSADAEEKSPADLAAAALEQRFGDGSGRHAPAQDEREAARRRFGRHIGSVSLGHPTGADNESIDADLDQAYANDPGHP